MGQYHPPAATTTSDASTPYAPSVEEVPSWTIGLSCNRSIFFARFFEEHRAQLPVLTTYRRCGSEFPLGAEKPLELIHSDIAGPLVMNKDGIQYYATAIDDYKGIIKIGSLGRKDEVKEFPFRNVEWLQQQLDHKVRSIRTDGGREYLGPLWDSILHRYGIVHQVTTPYSPQLTGEAERINRTLEEMAGAILRESHLPKEYWVEAIGYINTLILQARVVAQYKIAYEWLYRRKSKASELHPFGCEAYVHIPQENRLKNDMM